MKGLLHRIILDEAQKIGNANSKTSIFPRSLNAEFRWCCTATPCHDFMNGLRGIVAFLEREEWSNDRMDYNKSNGRLQRRYNRWLEWKTEEAQDGTDEDYQGIVADHEQRLQVARARIVEEATNPSNTVPRLDMAMHRQHWMRLFSVRTKDGSLLASVLRMILMGTISITQERMNSVSTGHHC